MFLLSYHTVTGVPNLYQFDLDFKEIDAVFYLFIFTLESGPILEDKRVDSKGKYQSRIFSYPKTYWFLGGQSTH